MGTGSSDLTPPRPPEGRPLANMYQPTGPVRIPSYRPGQAGAASRPTTVVQKTKLVRNLCNVRRDSLRLVRDTGQAGERYRLELRYSAEVSCSVSAYFLHDESLSDHAAPNGSRLTYRPRYPDRDCTIGPTDCPAGPDQLFVSAESVDLGGPLCERDLVGNETHGHAYFPLYILIRPHAAAVSEVGVAEECEISSQVTMANLRLSSNKAYSPKFVKQKIETASGAVFVLQEIYGIAKDGPGGVDESMSVSGGVSTSGGGGGEGAAEEDEDVSLADCVICLTNRRELTVLPCRHMCVCRYCASECFQSQESKCPICRNPAQALLKLTVGQTADNSLAPPGTLKTD